MKSVIDVTIGLPELVHHGILIPMGMHVSDDDGDDDGIPSMDYTWIKVFVSHETLSKGKSVIKEKSRDLVAEHRMDYAGSGYHKVVKSLDDFIDANDLAIYNVGWFPDPSSKVFH